MAFVRVAKFAVCTNTVRGDLELVLATDPTGLWFACFKGTKGFGALSQSLMANDSAKAFATGCRSTPSPGPLTEMA